MTTLLIDLTIIAIIAFCGWRGYRNGLIRGVFGVVTLIAALVFANIAAVAYADNVKGVMGPFVGGIVDSTLNDVFDKKVELETVDHEDDSEEFQISYTALRKIGLPKSAAINISEGVVGDDSEVFLADMLSDRLSSSLSFAAVFGVAFLLIAIIFAVIGNLISFVFSLPGLKLIDTIAGVLFGLIKGFLIVLVMTAVLRYFGVLAPAVIEKTAVLKYFIDHNLIANILGI